MFKSYQFFLGRRILLLPQENPLKQKFQNMMDSSGVKSRPKGPNNRRPPKKKPDRNATSPLDENPPMVNLI